MDALTEHLGQVVATIFENPVVQLLVWAAIAYVVLLWLASAWWVLQDLRRRHGDPVLPYVASGAVIVASPMLFPLAVFVYRIVRPGETLAEARERELSERLDALEAELSFNCPGCSRPVEEDWLVCPACRARLAHRCASCGRTMGLDWTLCGWCGKEFGATVLPERLPRPARAGARFRREKRTSAAVESGAAGGRSSSPARRALEPGA